MFRFTLKYNTLSLEFSLRLLQAHFVERRPLNIQFETEMNVKLDRVGISLKEQGVRCRNVDVNWGLNPQSLAIFTLQLGKIRCFKLTTLS